MEPIKLEIFNKYIQIKQDLMNNLHEVYDRQHYYTHKYRGNILTDINVAVGEAESGNFKHIQIYIRHKDLYFKENIDYNHTGHYESTIKTNIHE
tara:strand:- start:12508 stop:12789 length:282 start_codon:yes stop_codon:yes gene_type:complete